MKKFLLFSLFSFSIAIAEAQITITKNDFAASGDTFRISNAAGIGSNNLDSTGANMIWDYSSLVPLSQSVDTFVSVSSTPLLYQLYFNNQFLYPATKATVATKITVPNVPTGAGISVSNAYGFYKINTTAFSQVGFGATITTNGTGIPTSIPYDSLDYVYRFPMNYLNSDSCNYKFQVSIPNLGYLRRRAKRVNVVDGWGTLITPFGTFSTLRVKSTTYATDTIYITQLMFGTQIVQPPSVEYKWIGTNSGIPYLTVNAGTGPLPVINSVVYRDSLRPGLFLNSSEIYMNKVDDFTVYPNPVASQSLLSFDQARGGKVNVEVYDAKGKMVKTLFNNYLPEGFNAMPLDFTDLNSGLYFVRIKTDSFSFTKKVSRL